MGGLYPVYRVSTSILSLIKDFERKRKTRDLIATVCIAFFNLFIPTYVLVEFLEMLPEFNGESCFLTEYILVNKVIAINEKKRIKHC